MTNYTLTILTPDELSWAVWGPLHYAEYKMATEWATRGKDFSLDITSYTRNERETVLTRLMVQIMAGQVPDIIILDHQPWTDKNSLRNFLASGAFADIYEIIDNCPNSSKDDFFTNVLEAWEVDGRLHAFPIAFGFDYVGINANMPQSILDKFTAFDTISMHEILQLYIHIRKEYGDEFEHYEIFSNMLFYSPFHFLSHSMNGFIDFDNNVSLLNSDSFIALLEDWWQVFNGQGIFEFDYRRGIIMRSSTNILNLRIRADRYIFYFNSFGNEPINALIPNSNPYFIHNIPITDEQGRLRVSKTRLSTGTSTIEGIDELNFTLSAAGHILVPLISATADEAMAWEFVQHLVTSVLTRITWEELLNRRYEIRGHGIHTYWIISRNLLTPIRRSYFEQYTPNVLDHAVNNIPFWCHRRPRETDMEVANGFPATMARLATYNEMPISPPFMIPGSLFADLLDTFLRTPPGVFGAQQTAQELHNRVSLWLIE